MKISSVLAVLAALVSSATAEFTTSCGEDKKLLKLEIHFTLAVKYDNLFQLMDWCNNERISEQTQGHLPAGPYVFPFCLNPLNTYEIAFIDFKGIEQKEDPGEHDTFKVTFGGEVVVPETVLEHDQQVTVLFGTQCPPPPFTKGDPHFQTWSGKEFDFHGQCDLVLMTHPDFNNGEGLDIHVRTKQRYQYSFIETAALRIGNDIIEVMGFGAHAYNGVEGVEFPMPLGHTAMVDMVEQTDKSCLIEVNLMDGSRIMLKSFKDMVAVTMDRQVGGNMKHVQGVLGSSATYDMQARDGSVMNDPDAFGMEWQVRDTDPKLFTNKDNYPQWPQQCVMPQVTTEERRRLGEMSIGRDEAEKACGDAGRQTDIEGCIFDVVNTGDLEMAQAGVF